jgi:hypothetical protein
MELAHETPAEWQTTLDAVLKRLAVIVYLKTIVDRVIF